jgi:hypothetical protein
MEDIVDIIEGHRFSRAKEVGCYLCGEIRKARKIPVLFGMKAMIAECAACRIAFQTPPPSPEASLAYMNWRWRSADAYVADPAIQMERALRQIAFVNQCVKKPATLVDFGAGAGAFVRAAVDQGWEATGIEQSDSARGRARDFFGVDLLSELDSKSYDVATLWDVVEHLRDPAKTLAMIREHLTDDGLVFIETGNFENWRRVLEKDEWELYLFDHQFYLSPTSLKRILGQAGYEGFRQLNRERDLPSLHPKRILQHPSVALRSWMEWGKARLRWPAHGDLRLLVVVAKKAA